MMRLPVALILAVVLVGCHGETSRPEASGKGTIRAINAIATSPDLSFLIEQRVIGNVGYKNNTSPASWDDISYTFNFDALLADGEGITRIASQPLDVIADTEHTLVIRGDLQSPTVTVWDVPQREFGENASVFELRVGHASSSLGRVDVYFALEGVAPADGQEIARLAPGGVTAPADYDQDRYVLTVTRAGKPNNVLYQSAPALIVDSQSVLITLFDGDANDPSPFFARVFNQVGQGTNLPDGRFLPTVRYIHATTDLDTSDIYDDADLTNRIFAGLAFGEATGDIDTAVGDTPITFTTVDNVGSILFDTTVTTSRGSRYSAYITRDDDGLALQRVIVDRRSVETIAKLSYFHSAANHGRVDFYVVGSGQSIDDAFPVQVGLPYGTPSGSIGLPPRDYDIYVTTAGEKTILDGPVPLTAGAGDVFEGILIDRTDPNLAEFRILPPP